ncbi:PREDICTED: coiled-coil domain-containing protein 94 [Ceratosolen solmsi marchali]|uniref:Splicing factor YJU2 n=1 Tax=Ceratosolen solmsi marchali TaxID=326594 RepID=A0AAJ7DYA8_9HYME|nr:PREDICTED: coiled-coil domain-containing protein 94 [Ceratosolen solmsi marchali]
MSERKVLNKYYPPDFDPSKIPRMKLARNRQYTVRLMAPFNMRCKTCGEYIYKGKKFNARKEDVEGDTYLGIRIYRFYIKCTRCLQEISFKTDPKNTDYEIEAGATRNFMALKLAEEQAKREEDEEKEEEATNPMKLLEKRTHQSKQELELLESLEELKDLNRRQQAINYDQMLEQYDIIAARQRTEKEQEEYDEQLIKQIFKNKNNIAGKVIEEEIIEAEDNNEMEPPKKIQKLSAPSAGTAFSGIPLRSSMSIADKRKNLGIKVKSVNKCVTSTISSNTVMHDIENDQVSKCSNNISNVDSEQENVHRVDGGSNIMKQESTGSTVKTASGLSLLGTYSGSSEESD